MKIYKYLFRLDAASYILIVLLLAASLVTPIPLTVEANGATIYVPDDHPTIQDAIGNATAGDTIIVRDGNTYEESIQINKQLTIQGEDRYTTIIDAMGDLNAVEINADNVQIQGFTLHNATNGIVVDNHDGAKFIDCVVCNFSEHGFSLLLSDSINMQNCQVYNNGIWGVYLWMSRNFTASGCEVYDGHDNGICIEYSEEILFDSCDFYENDAHGVFLYSSEDVIIEDCVQFGNTLTGTKSEFSERVFITNGTIYDNSESGIWMIGSNEAFIAGCEVYDNAWDGISVSSSDFISVIDCSIYNNNDNGVALLGSSDFARIINCETYNNSNYGVELRNSHIVSICNVTSIQNGNTGLFAITSNDLYVSESRFENTGIGLSYSTGVIVSCNITSNYYGIHAGGSDIKMKFSSITDNVVGVVNEEGLIPINATYNWWGNESGPYDSINNPTGTGDEIIGDIIFEPWQMELYQPDTLISDMRCQIAHLDWLVVYPDDETPKPLGCSAAMVSDWLASAFVTTKLPSYIEGVDTNATYVNQSTGKPIGDPGIGILTFGGPKVNPVVKRAENETTPDADRAPVKFHREGDIFHFQYANGTDIPGASLPLSVINEDEDMFVIETYMDGDGRLMVVCYGFGWQGTYAAGKFFDSEVFPHLGEFTDGWVIVHWEDSNVDGFVNEPGKGDVYTEIATGN